MKARSSDKPKPGGRTRAAAWLAALALALPASAGALPPVFSTPSGGAIRGYDPVAYFTEKRPVKGEMAFSHEWKGAVWRFSSARNLALFRAAPGKYAPRYGGYCAYAVSRGYTASIDPDAWRIVKGKLYLNYSPGVQRFWEADIPRNVRRADQNWPGLLGKR